MTGCRVALLLGATLLLAGCEGMQSALDAKGSGAIEIKQLIIGIVAVCTIVWALVMAVLIRALTRPRGNAGASVQTERKMTTVVSGAVAATVIIIAGLTIASFYTTRSISVAADGDLIIKVRGHQWWWRVLYVDPDPAKSFETANELHIPAGKNVRLQLESADVIHSFWVPSLAGKQDLIPGRLNELTIRAERPGIYRGQCAEFCGIQHSHMAMLVIAEDNADYEKWVVGQRADGMA